MPKIATKDSAKQLRPFVFHGLDLSSQEDHPKCDCPFCGNDQGKFSVTTDKGTYGCFVCGAKGNIHTFLRELWKIGGNGLDPLARDRKLLGVETLIAWEVVSSPLTGDILIPGYGIDGKLNQLYKYVKGKGDKKVLLPTPEIGHQLHGVNLFDKGKGTVYVCEGPWDGMALWEMLRQSKRTEEGLRLTASESSSLLSDANVIAVPGCGSIGEPFKRWLPLFRGKHVVLCFDNDHPKEVNGKAVEGAGFSATKRAASMLGEVKSVSYLKWGEDDAGYDARLDSGWDVRDHLSRGSVDNAGSRLAHLDYLLGRIKPVPAEWIGKSSHVGAARIGGPDDCLLCSDWKTLLNSWKKSGLRLTEGLERTLAVMMASVLSTPHVGEQLWVMILGPASSAKTTFCEALGVAKDWVISLDTFTRLTSGYQVDKEGSENLSLVGRLHNKTLVLNDGDTLLRLPNREQVLSQLRAFYGRNIRASYANKMSKDHEGVNATIILAGTASLLELDSAELGSRFLVSDIGVISEELEDEIGWRVANRAAMEMNQISDGKIETRDTPEMVEAKRMTGGFVNHLRANSPELLSKVSFPAEHLKLCQSLAKFVAFLRSRPSKKQEEKVERELSFRLTSQHVRLAKALAAVMGTDVDDDVMDRVRGVAFNSSQGRTQKLCKELAEAGEEGLTLGRLCNATHHTEDQERKLLKHLRSIKAVAIYTKELPGSKQQRWRLTKTMAKLWKEVHTDA